MRVWFLALLGLLLAACGREPATSVAFQGTDIHDAPIRGDFRLMGSDGRPHRMADFRGRVVLITFGYTHCGDVCPGTLAELARARRLLGQDGDRVQVLFVSVDPARDTGPVLARFVGRFDPSFLGLYGDAAATARTAKDFHIFYQKQAAGADPGPAGVHGHHGHETDGYGMAHSTGTYVFDPQGRVRVFLRYGTPARAVAHDVRLLLG